MTGNCKFIPPINSWWFSWGMVNMALGITHVTMEEWFVCRWFMVKFLVETTVSANFLWIPFRRAGDGFSLHSGILKPCETEIRSSRSLLFFGKTFGKPRSHSDLDIPVFSWAKLLIVHPPRRLAERIAEFQGLLGTPQTRLELESSRLANKKWRR